MRGCGKISLRKFCHKAKNRPVQLVLRFYWLSPVFLKLGQLSDAGRVPIKVQIPLVHLRLMASGSEGVAQESAYLTNAPGDLDEEPGRETAQIRDFQPWLHTSISWRVKKIYILMSQHHLRPIKSERLRLELRHIH